MKKIKVLTDYKGYYGSKWNATPYRSGYDQSQLTANFHQYGYELEFIKLNDIRFKEDLWKDRIVLYTSSEEAGFHYKGFIEDVILGLERLGAILVPSFDMLRANNNKVFMEIIREAKLNSQMIDMNNRIYGTLEELDVEINEGKVEYPCVLKKAEGSMSRGVYLANNSEELLRFAKKISRTRHFKSELQEVLRIRKHKGYKPESKHQGKFIIQPFIPGLKNDWKVLIYWDHYYILKRHVRKNDFRASGSGVNYKAGSEAGFPLLQLNYLKEVFMKSDTPNLSIDFGYDGKTGYIFEFQGIFFGTSTQYKSRDYYLHSNNEWLAKNKILDQEGEFVYSIVKFLDVKGLNK